MRSNSLRKMWDKSDLFKRVFIFMFFGRAKRIDFYDSMKNYLEIGASLSECFDNLIIDSDATNQKQLLIYTIAKENIEKGQKLNDALTCKNDDGIQKKGLLSNFSKKKSSKSVSDEDEKPKHISFVPHNELAMIESGEKADKLVKAVKNIKNQLEVITDLQNHFLMRVIPTFIVAILAFASITYQVSAYSEIRDYFIADDVELPELVSNFFAVGDVLLNHTALIAVALLTFIALIAYSLPNYTGRYRKGLQNKLPPWNVYRNFKASEFFLSFSSLMNSGMKTSDSLSLMLPYSNRYLRNYLSVMRQKVQRGKEDRVSFDTELFPLRTRLVLFAILKTETKSLADGVSELSVRQTKQAKKSVNKFAALSASFLFFTIVAFVIWSMIVSFELQDIIGANFGE